MKWTHLRDYYSVMEAITVFINGDKYIVDNNVHPAMRLADFLRQVARLKGTKVMCREGGCGACVITAEYTDTVTQTWRTKAINSCLCPIAVANGWHITTTEGLGNEAEGFHPIQRAMADHSATQCGYCTPGFVMSAYGLLKDNPKASSGELEKALDGNMCRCTGYRPISDAMKSLTKDGICPGLDIEDLSSQMCNKTTNPCKVESVMTLRPVSHQTWQRPKSLDQLLELLNNNSDKKIKLVCGNTATGVYKSDWYGLYCITLDIPELYLVKADGNFLELGANLTLSHMQEIFIRESTKCGFEYLCKVAEFMDLIANKPIRNVGSWAGNLVMQHDHPEFTSDIYTPFEAVGAFVTIADKTGTETLCLDELMSVDLKNKVIFSVKLPALQSNDLFEVYKVMSRSRASYGYVNAAFKISCSNDSSKTVISASIVFNGVGPNKHQEAVEKHLIGKSVSDSLVISESLRILGTTLQVQDDNPRVSAQYKKSLAKNLLYKFLCQISSDSSTVPLMKLIRPPSQGKQEFSTSPEDYPITQPIQSLSAKQQASGEVVYVDDMPKLEGELSAVLVLSTIAEGEIESIEIQQALAAGAVDVVTAKDIKGVNMISDSFKVLAENEVEHNGQPIAVILADDLGTAYKAARSVNVTYKNVEKGVIDIEEAILKKQIHFRLPSTVIGNTGDAFNTCSKLVKGKFSHGSQYHFYIENQVSLCRPSEGGYVIWSTSQWADNVQTSVASVIGVAANSIHVTVPRLGGGFGGKAHNNGRVAALCALAAQKTKRPVRLPLSLETNMKINGHRQSLYATYKVGLDSCNTITAVEADIYWNGGHRPLVLVSAFLNSFVKHMDSAYYIPNWSVDAAVVKTDVPTTSPLRSPGQMPGHLLAEHIMDHIAHSVGEDVVSFKRRHFYQQGQLMLCKALMPDNTLHELWEATVSASDLTNRKQFAEQFNQTNKWVKRGIAVSPARFTVRYAPNFNYPVYLAVYHHDGSVIISHGGSEMGQGLHTKVTQVAARELGVPMELIKIHPVNSLTAPNTIVTAGSQTSEYLCRTVQECCKLLLEKLCPVREKNPDADWNTLVKQAYMDGINMAVTERYVSPKVQQLDYNVYGVCVAEAEVDILTGQSQILRADMHMDIGQSVNPLIDVGQVEGSLVMGLGFMLHEHEVYDPRTGELLTASTWDYKPPTIFDVPADIRIHFMKNKPNQCGVYSSKAIGEPPMCATPAFLHAVKAAISASRKERGNNSYFDLYAPATPEVILSACDVKQEHLII